MHPQFEFWSLKDPFASARVTRFVRRPKIVRIVACFIIEWSKPLCDIAAAVAVQLYASASSFDFNPGLSQRHCVAVSPNHSTPPQSPSPLGSRTRREYLRRHGRLCGLNKLMVNNALLKPSHSRFVHVGCSRCLFNSFPMSLHIAVKVPKFRIKIMPRTENLE